MSGTADEKRKWMVQEIETWRRGKMLPESYCDFLLNLYLEDVNDRPKTVIGAAMRRIDAASWRKWMLVFGIFTFICLVVLYFSAFHPALQIGLVGLVTTGFIALGGWRQERFPLQGRMAYGAGMAFLLGTGIGVLQLNGWGDGAGPIVLLSVCAAVWIGCGIALRSTLMHMAGWLAVVSLYALLLHRYAGEPTWPEIQLFWLPASLLFIWCSWFLHVRIKSAGTVLFAVGLLLWFMPELYAAAIAGLDAVTVQAQLVVKVAIAGVAMYRFRKKWMEWVA